MGKHLKGFTLIELMIIVAIMSILTVIALPKFGKMIQKAYEGRGKGNLGALRSAMSIYYSANEGRYIWSSDCSPDPADPLHSFQPLVPSYIDEIPGAYTGQKQAWGKDTGGGMAAAGPPVNPLQYHEGNNRSCRGIGTYSANNDYEGEWYWFEYVGKIVWINCTLKDSHDNYVTSW